MNNMQIQLLSISTDSDLKRVFQIMSELRPHLTFNEYLEIYNQAKLADNYQIVAAEFDDEIVALIGFRVLSDFVRGKHLYVDDLISIEKFRSRGIGAKLLEFAKERAKEFGCKSLRLCTGIENIRATKFYESNGWSKRAFAFTIKLEV